MKRFILRDKGYKIDSSAYSLSTTILFRPYRGFKDRDLDLDYFLNLEQLITGEFTVTVRYIL